VAFVSNLGLASRVAAYSHKIRTYVCISMCHILNAGHEERLKSWTLRRVRRIYHSEDRQVRSRAIDHQDLSISSTIVEVSSEVDSRLNFPLCRTERNSHSLDEISQSACMVGATYVPETPKRRTQGPSCVYTYACSCMEVYQGSLRRKKTHG